ncbi:MAG: biotin--[acetyl-CoA-carboxylase] ligase [Desulfobacteraceae bacterium]
MTTQYRLLLCLKENRGDWVSGESLSKRLSVSRSAVWKNIGNLRTEGYVIESAPKKGYRLLRVPDLLLPAEILDGLQTRNLGRGKIAHFMDIDSTNDRAKEMALGGATEGTVVVAEKQARGRGRKGRAWFSPSTDGIYCSVILRPGIPPADGPKLTFLSAVAAAEALQRLTPLRPTIKWPNDILINGKKVAGILTEMASEPDAITYVVVGMGMNVNTRGFPEEIGPRATSVFRETHEPVSRVGLLQAYLEQTETWYGALQEKGFGPIVQRWRNLADIEGKHVRVEMMGKTIEGRVRDIDSDGLLRVEDKNGTSHRIICGDVFFL